MANIRFIRIFEFLGLHWMGMTFRDSENTWQNLKSPATSVLVLLLKYSPVPKTEYQRLRCILYASFFFNNNISEFSIVKKSNKMLLCVLSVVRCRSRTSTASARSSAGPPDAFRVTYLPGRVGREASLEIERGTGGHQPPTAPQEPNETETEVVHPTQKNSEDPEPSN